MTIDKPIATLGLPQQDATQTPAITSKSRARTLLDMAMLYASKTGAILVGVIFLPIYHQRLGNDAFGIVAVILSIQAFAVMVDFGMSVLVGREVARLEHGAAEGLAIWRQAEAAVSAVYASILLLTLMACLATGTSGDQSLIYLACVLFFLLTVLQNIAQTALLAQKRYVIASAIQVCGVTFRAAITVAALVHAQAGILTFLAVQLAATALYLLVTRHYCRKFLVADRDAVIPRLEWDEVWHLLRRGRPLFLTGLAGAAVMQLDKPTLSAFVPSGDVSPYFLAMSASILPTALLAAPLVQYFQPQIIRLMESPRSASSEQTITQFTLAVIFAVAVPSWILWHWADPIVRLWLRSPDQVGLVVSYMRTLLPGFALGSLCYVPVVLLLAAQDFKYQAVTSVAMTVATLGLVLAFAFVKRVDLVCYAYLGYFIAASVSVWWRSLTLPSTQQWAKLSASKSILPILTLSLAAAAMSVKG